VTGPDAKLYLAADLAPDRAWLIATVSDLSALYVWDLRLIRRQLKELDMDWDWPEFAPAAVEETHNAPSRVTVDAGLFRKRTFEDDHQAVVAYSLLLALQPINPEAYLQRGLAHGRLKEAAKAIADYDLFLALTSKTDRRRQEILMRRV